jgi:glutaconate CoA-transferase subunit B
LHHGVTREQVQENTGFELKFDDKIETTALPRAEELEVLRELDPQALYTA